MSKTRSQISKNNMRKATAFQRKVAKMFQTYFKECGYDYEFHSTPRSGGLRWQQRSDVIGDVVTPENFLYTIECKKHNDIDLHCLFLDRGPNTTQDIINWWNQACDEAKRAERQPMLVFEKKRGMTIVVIPHNTYLLQDTLETTITACLNVDSRWREVVLLPLKTLFESVEPVYFLGYPEVI